MSNNLVIVESPTKAKTLQRFLGDKYRIEASMGHIRDLPKSELGVDTKKDFEPQYVIPRDKRKRVNELKNLASNAQTLYLATDPDREGEAIAWHIKELLEDKKVKNDVKRVVFHEITEEAIKDAFDHPRQLDLQLVNAQQARRVLDRLVGYKLSPLLWQKIKKGSSAGRVQSVALRLIVEREREVKAFNAEEYWTIEAQLKASENKNDEGFIALLIEKNGEKISVKNQIDADSHVKNLEKASYIVEKVTQKETRRFPYPPFTTSTLQQTAANKLGMSAKKTMMIAQALYEHGLITYMRTDSVNLSTQSINSVRAYIENNIGKLYMPSVPRIFKSKSKNAQEAHEAIRPTNVLKTTEQLKSNATFNRDHARLYDLIWKRFVACQMSEAIIDQTTADIKAKEYLLRANGSVIKFEGWLKLYGKTSEKTEDEQQQTDSEEGKEEKDLSDPLSKKQVLPPLEEKSRFKIIKAFT